MHSLCNMGQVDPTGSGHIKYPMPIKNQSYKIPPMRYWRSCMIGIGIRLHHRDARRSFTKHQVSEHLRHPGEQTLGGYSLQRTIIDAHFTMSQTWVCTVSWGEPNCFFNIARSHWLPPTSTFESFRLNLKTPYIHYYQNQNAKYIQGSGRGY
jgi:hypothetical protein